MEKLPINAPEDLTSTASAEMTTTDSQEAHDVVQSALSHNPAQLMSESGTDAETGNEDEQTEILQAVREGKRIAGAKNRTRGRRCMQRRALMG